jgi:hypothetical protein
MSVPKDEIYAAHLYPPEAIPELVQALALMRRSYQVLDQLLEEGKIKQGEPAAEACDRLVDAIGMMEPEDDDACDSDKVAKPAALHLVVDNT